MNQQFTLGVDFGATSIKFGVVQDGRITKHGNVVPTGQGWQNRSIDQVNRRRDLQAPTEYPALQAVGLEVPGIIDPAAGVVVNLNNVKGWHRIPLGALVSALEAYVGHVPCFNFLNSDSIGEFQESGPLHAMRQKNAKRAGS